MIGLDEELAELFIRPLSADWDAEVISFRAWKQKVDAVRHGHKAPALYCRNGHAYSPETSTRHKRGPRVCLLCARAASKRHYNKHKGVQNG